MAARMGKFASSGLRYAGLFVALVGVLVAGRLAIVTPVIAATTTVQAGQQNGGTLAADQFNAATIGINTGDTVHWSWFSNPFGHEIVSYNQTAGLPDWQSPAPLTGAGQSYDHMFTQKGTFTYYCSIHALRTDADPATIDANLALGKMVGKITVTSTSVGGVAVLPDVATLARSTRSSGGGGKPNTASLALAVGVVAIPLAAVAGRRVWRALAGDSERTTG